MKIIIIVAVAMMIALPAAAQKPCGDFKVVKANNGYATRVETCCGWEIGAFAQPNWSFNGGAYKGFSGGALIGYRWHLVHVDAKVSYGRLDFDASQASNVLRATADVLLYPLKHHNFTVNPYFGGVLGYTGFSNSYSSDVKVDGGVMRTTRNWHASSPTLGGVIGVDVRIIYGLHAFAACEYTWFSLSDPSYKYNQHSISLQFGVKVLFNNAYTAKAIKRGVKSKYGY